MGNLAVSHLVEESYFVEDENGARFIDIYLIENLTGSTSVETYGAAVNIDGLPQYGDPLANSVGMFVSRREFRPFAKNSKTQLKCYVTYTPPSFQNPGDTITTFHGTTKQYQTNKHRDGSIIKVDYTESTTHKAFPQQVGLVTGTRAEGVLSFDFIWWKDPTVFIEVLNCMNSKKWRGGDKWTWLCADVQVEKVKYRGYFHVMMSFLYDETTHIEPAFYRIDPGHIIPSDVQDWFPNIDTDGRNGWTNADLNPEADFNQLQLPSAF